MGSVAGHVDSSVCLAGTGGYYGCVSVVSSSVKSSGAQHQEFDDVLGPRMGCRHCNASVSMARAANLRANLGTFQVIHVGHVILLQLTELVLSRCLRYSRSYRKQSPRNSGVKYNCTDHEPSLRTRKHDSSFGTARRIMSQTTCAW